jgi:ATP-binding cassette, subfamily B, bacterial MsbA
MKTYFRLLSFARPIGKYAAPYIIFTLLSVIFGTLNLALLAPLLSTLFGNESTNQVIQRPENAYDIFKMFNYYSYVASQKFGLFRTLEYLCMITVSFVLIGNIFRYLAQRTMENLRIHTLSNLRKAVFKNIMQLQVGYFNNSRKGDIMAKIASDVQVVQYSVTASLQVIFKEPLTILAYLLMLFLISYKLTLVSMLIIPVSAYVISKIVKKLRSQAVAAQQTFGNMISYLEEAVSGIRIIKSFNAVNFIIKKFNKENDEYSRIIRQMVKRQQMASPVSEFLGIIMVAGIVLYGGSLVLSNKGDLTAANFIAYIALFSQIMRPAKAISGSFSNIHSGIAAGERVLELIDEKPTITDHPNAVELQEFRHEISFKQVTFSYGEYPVLKNISFCIPKGKSIALVGPSGAGKSTLMDLICRFIEPCSGKIVIDGKPVECYKTTSLRALMGIVNQDSVLFNDTIFNNIAFGKPDATLEQVEHAAKIANAFQFISETKKGFYTNIGDMGVKLSGGQRQRICIARAVLNNPPIMLLDEATSALDTESEKEVQTALNKLMANRTSLVIAHRLSTIQNADQIIVLDNGCIREKGSHAELVAADGFYKKLIDMQTFSAD